MKRQKKKGQAALEFLTTYGWAFTIVLVMIGSLAYFGVLRTDMFLPERCLFESGITCKESQAEVGGNVKARLINTFGKPVQIINATVSCQGVTANCQDCAAGNNWCELTAGSDIWRSEEERELIILTGGIQTSDKPKITITIRYKYPDDYFEKATTGDLYLRPS